MCADNRGPVPSVTVAAAIGEGVFITALLVLGVGLGVGNEGRLKKESGLSVLWMLPGAVWGVLAMLAEVGVRVGLTAPPAALEGEGGAIFGVFIVLPCK